MPLAISAGTPSRPQGTLSVTPCCTAAVSLRPRPLGASDKGLRAHIGLDHAGMNRIHPDPIALASELQRRRFGEQRDPALGHRVKRIELRADNARDRGEVNDGAAMLAGFRGFPQSLNGQPGAKEHARSCSPPPAFPTRPC